MWTPGCGAVVARSVRDAEVVSSSLITQTNKVFAVLDLNCSVPRGKQFKSDYPDHALAPACYNKIS